MATVASSAQPLQVAAPSVSPRLASIDIFRGLTMAVMIFVNDLDGIRGLPWWTHHAPGKVDVMTYVDMVFPFFLFIIGLSMPLSIRQRLKKNSSQAALWLHVLLRSLGLVVLGLILANAERGSQAFMGINPNLWALIALLGASFYLSVDTGSRRSIAVHRVLRIVGLLMVIAMYAIYRRATPDGHSAWMNITGYPEILGLIGFTFFAVAILYIPTRRWQWMPFVWFVLLVAFNALCTAKWIVLPRHLSLFAWPFGSGELGSITMGGIVTSVIFLGDHKWQSLKQKMSMAAIFAVITLIAGRVLTPLGISKIRGTPTWALYCVGAAVICFAILYWICDVKKHTRWAFFVRPAGANTLLTYLLPDFYFFLTALVGFTFFDTHLNAGWPGVFTTVFFTAAILAVSGVLTRLKIRLQL